MVILKVRCESDDWSFINDHFYDFRTFALFSFFGNNIMMYHGVGSLWFRYLDTCDICLSWGNFLVFFLHFVFSLFLELLVSNVGLPELVVWIFSLSSLFNCSVLLFFVYLFYSLRIFSMFAIRSIEFQISSTYLMFKIRFLFFL